MNHLASMITEELKTVTAVTIAVEAIDVVEEVTTDGDVEEEADVVAVELYKMDI